jgi:hypothetical protein
MHVFGKRVDWLETGVDVAGVILVLIGIGFLIGSFGVHAGTGKIVLLAFAFAFLVFGGAIVASAVRRVRAHRRRSSGPAA